MSRLARNVFAAAAAFALAAIALGGVARADDAATCTVRSIWARPVAGGVDARLGDLKAQLESPPFTAWKSFQLIDTDIIPLRPGGTGKFALVDGRTGTLSYLQHLGPQGGRHRVRLRLQVTHQGAENVNTTFVLDEGGTVLIAGHPHQDGITILGVSCATGA